MQNTKLFCFINFVVFVQYIIVKRLFVWCGRQHRCLLHNGISRRKKLKKTNKKQADMVQPVFLKVGLGNNCLMPNVNDIVPRVWRINRIN